VQALLVAGALGMFFLAVLYLQRVLGFDALETGVAFLPVSLAIGVLSLGFSARLNLRFGARAVLVPGMVLVALGLAWLTRAPADGSYAIDVLPAMLLLGIGAGVSFPALMTLAMSGADQADAGLASGLVNTTMQVGGALGIAVLATLSSSRTDTLRGAGASAAEALTGGYHLAFTVSAVLVGIGALVAATVLQREPAVASEDASEVAFQTT
jgi:MFS family permease